jgi:hypothetical protein
MIKYETPLKVRSIIKIVFGPTTFNLLGLFHFSAWFFFFINLAYTSLFAFPSIKDCVPVLQLPKESHKVILQALSFHLLE